LVGIPIGATVVYDDGASRHFDDVAAALAQGDEGRVELLYRYRPDALPVPGIARWDMWRYGSLLPVELGTVLYPLPVGGTPLLALPELRLATGMPHLWLKDETRSPTGSNKDRATALVLQQAINAGVGTVTCASTGNAAVSLAAGAAASGKRAVVFVPADVAESKLHLIRAAGAAVLKVKEGYAEAFRLSRLAVARFGWYDRNTGLNPITVDAKKTVAFEIWEQLDRQVPDAVVVPVGDGPTLNGIAKGFRELVKCGGTRRVPRIVGVQAEGCQPIKRAWETRSHVQAVHPATIADGIAVGTPVSGATAIRDVQESGGAFVSVSDAEILYGMRTLAKAGIFAEPAAAAAFAGLRPARDAGLLAPCERVVALVTGSGLKVPQLLAPLGPAFEVHADLDEVAHVLNGLKDHGRRPAQRRNEEGH
jgi:threonine synthase